MLDAAGLFAEIDRHFLEAERLRRVALFARAPRLAEGWFKGELMYLLEGLANERKVGRWAADVPITEDRKKRCDFRVELEGEPAWLEVKTLHYGTRGGIAADILSGMSDAVGVTDDVIRLLRVPDGTPHIVLFVFPRPATDAWAETMGSYKRRIAPIGVEEESSPEGYPEALYVCKLAVSGGF